MEVISHLRGGGYLGVLPHKIFGLNCVKSYYFRQNKHENGTFMEARDSVYDGRRANPFLNFEVKRIFQICTLCIILASGASQKKIEIR